MDKQTEKKVLSIAEHFGYEGKLLSMMEYGNGHINNTYRLDFEDEPNMGYKSVILQQMNKNVFKNPPELMENIERVTSFLKEKILKKNGNPYRETLTVIPAKDGKSYYLDEDGNYWRSYIFITDVVSYDIPKNADDFYETAYAFGTFQSMLSDYPAETLHETIVNFHNTKVRFAAFKKAVEEDVAGRVSEVQEEIQFILERESIANYFSDLMEKGELPIRVTHNDTKINNILIDPLTSKGICVVDLDTVMPGLAMNDFGDSIRSGASTGAEDETDLSKISCDMDLFEVYTKGFMEGCAGKLTKKEIELLPMGALTMTWLL